jgi:formyltetrahydrofolate-dependent phosphoribosylglycinamide formyltransferase
MKRLAVFISGNGSNLQALIEAIQNGQLDAKIVVVVSNRQNAYGLVRAEQAGIPTVYFPLKPYREAGQPREAYDSDLAEIVAAYQPDLIILAGWMHILSSAFLDQFPNRVLNLHPALPGQFVGTQAIERAFEAFQRGEIDQTGVMVHLVIPEVDAGPVIGITAVPINQTDSLNDLTARIHSAEHQLLVEAVGQVVTGLRV